IFEVSDFYANYGDFLVSAEKHLAKADTGISRLKMKETTYLNDEGKEETFVVPFACHVVEGREYERRLIDESRGTQALYVLMRYILPVLKLGGIAIIDEFETGLHAHVVKYVVELFYSKSTNPYGAQLIANFHTDFLLNSTFEKYQIVLAEKDPETQSTDAWRLDKVKGIARNANNHYAKYHAGAYGGVPNI
ncbi:MAG: ATP-binding protein, partial [Opitutales bacterium]|nr:ATP-binding protein [Opitutales bacterium]